MNDKNFNVICTMKLLLCRRQLVEPLVLPLLSLGAILWYRFCWLFLPAASNDDPLTSAASAAASSASSGSATETRAGILVFKVQAGRRHPPTSHERPPRARGTRARFCGETSPDHTSF